MFHCHLSVIQSLAYKVLTSTVDIYVLMSVLVSTNMSCACF